MHMKRTILVLALMGMLVGVMPVAFASNSAQRVSVTGEVIDTWCYVTEIMFAEGTAHHQCAVWCAVGGIPISILGEDGQVYVVLKLEESEANVSNPTSLKIQSHNVSVNGDLYQRDGVNYLFITQVEDDHGIVNLTHDEYGIVPFGE